MNSNKHYLVEWQIDIFDADTPEEAARKAFEAMQRKGTWATVFHVTEVLKEGDFDGRQFGELTMIDLLDLTD